MSDDWRERARRTAQRWLEDLDELEQLARDGSEPDPAVLLAAAAETLFGAQEFCAELFHSGNEPPVGGRDGRR